ncbi:unnamed protein product, partial [Timema podura]|nr:unnamed protein product [Timema podura]
LTVQLQIEEISRKLRTGELGIPLNPEDSIACQCEDRLIDIVSLARLEMRLEISSSSSAGSAQHDLKSLSSSALSALHDLKYLSFFGSHISSEVCMRLNQPIQSLHMRLQREKLAEYIYSCEKI